MKSVTDGSMFRHSSWTELAGMGYRHFQPDDHQVTTGILLADALVTVVWGLPKGSRRPQFCSRCVIPPARQPV
jgi:hypothetical protein